MIKFFSLFCFSFLPLYSFTPEESLDKLFAIHATKIFPKENVLLAGFSRKPCADPLALSLYPDLRDTVHFTLGELVRPIQVGDQIYGWEDCPYAVVIPLKTLIVQLINLNCYDLFTLGSVPLDDSATLVLPEDQLSKVPENHRYAIWTYNPHIMKIREAVESLISEKKGWHVRMISNHSEDALDPAYLENTNIDINQPTFFSFLKKDYPHITIMGLRWQPFEGNGYLFGKLELEALPLIKSLLNGSFEIYPQPKSLTTEELETQLTQVQQTAKKIDNFIKNSPYASHLKWEYDDKRYALNTWIHIFEVEIMLNRSFNKTLKGAPKTVWEIVDLYRNSLEDLREQMIKVQNKLPTYQLDFTALAVK